VAELITLARPYAKAAFETALQHEALDKWSSMIALSAAVASNERVSGVLTSPSLSSLQIAEAFIAVCGDELDEKGKNFIALLAENKRLVLLPEISSMFETLKANQEMSVDVEITTAFEISSDVSNKLAQALKDRLKREIILATKVDQSLIGGAIIRAGDNVIDSSVRGKLSKLAESMNS
jgi:F-type H+-transporting ATPase subunit delta